MEFLEKLDVHSGSLSSDDSEQKFEHVVTDPPEEECDSAKRHSSSSILFDVNVEFNTQPQGRIVGGKFVKSIVEDEAASRHSHLPLTIIDLDLPLTLTETKRHGDTEVIMLAFASGDRDNPFNWSRAKKWLVTALLCAMTLFIGLATTAYSSGINQMAQDLNTSTELGQMGLFVFNAACAVVPLVMAPLCEMVGRKLIYCGAYMLFTICFIGLALGRNIATILVLRTLLGVFGCIGTILVGGTFADLWVDSERQKPMALWSYVAILGTVGAPIYAGFINETIGWRWTEGIQGLSNLPLLLLVCLYLQETRGGAILKKRAKSLRRKTGNQTYKSPKDIETQDLKHMFHVSSVKVLYMLFTEPVVFTFGLWIAFSWFVVFLYLSVTPITYQENRGWGQGIAGLPYISLALGTTFAYLANFIQIRRYERLKRTPIPEDRLYGALFGAPFLPLGLFIYAFTQYGFIPWIAPTIALAPIAFGIFFIFESTYSFTNDCYGAAHSSSATAAQSFLRNSLGAVAPLFASQMLHGMGSQWAGLLLACVATVLGLIPFVMLKYGSVLRKRSDMCMKG